MLHSGMYGIYNILVPKDSKKKKKGKDEKMHNMKGGIKFRDMKIGLGDVIKPGDKVRVFYVGQLHDRKVFGRGEFELHRYRRL